MECRNILQVVLDRILHKTKDNKIIDISNVAIWTTLYYFVPVLSYSTFNIPEYLDQILSFLAHTNVGMVSTWLKHPKYCRKSKRDNYLKEENCIIIIFEGM